MRREEQISGKRSVWSPVLPLNCYTSLMKSDQRTDSGTNEVLIFAGPLDEVREFAKDLEREGLPNVVVGAPEPESASLVDRRPLGQGSWEQIAVTILLNLASAELYTQVRERVRKFAANRSLKPKNPPETSPKKEKQ